MATLDLPDSILQTLENVLQQLQQNLPELRQPTDFSASAYKWQNQQLKAIQQPKKIYLDDLKGIERQKEKFRWEFLFLGANIDAVETAKHFGIGEDRAVNFHCDSNGTQLNYDVVEEAISAVRQRVPLRSDWKKRIDEDFVSRKKDLR